jgi:hypothetical protein
MQELFFVKLYRKSVHTELHMQKQRGDRNWIDKDGDNKRVMGKKNIHGKKKDLCRERKTQLQTGKWEIHTVLDGKKPA